MAFHAVCLTVVFPLFIMVAVYNRRFFRRWRCRLIVALGILAVLTMIVVLPELIVNKIREGRSDHVESSQ